MHSPTTQTTALTTLALRWHVFKYVKEKGKKQLLISDWGTPTLMGQLTCDAPSLDAKIVQAYGKGCYCALAYPDQIENLAEIEPILVKRITVADQATSELLQVTLEDFIGREGFFGIRESLTPGSVAQHVWRFALYVRMQIRNQPKPAPNRKRLYDEIDKLVLGPPARPPRQAMAIGVAGFSTLSSADQAEMLKKYRDARRKRTSTKKLRKVKPRSKK